MLEQLTDLLKRLSATAGVSGYESSVRSLVLEHCAPLVDEISVDRVGNVIAQRRGTQNGDRRRSVMLSAHMDEIGLMVTDLDGEFLRFSPVGGIDQRVLPGQEVLVHGECALPGIIASRPPHVVPTQERDRVIRAEELFVDVGLRAAELRDQVGVGDVISFLRPPAQLVGNMLTGKALDNRSSVAALCACLERLAHKQPVWDVYAVASVQEEHGDYLGATSAAFRIRPDVALVVDTTYGAAPGLSAAETTDLDAGPALSIGPNIHPALYRRLAALADAAQIPRQVEPLPGHSGTEGWGIQVSREGIPTAIISLPIRNMHTPVEIISTMDVVRAGQLMADFAAGLDDSFVEQLTPKFNST